MRTTSGRSASYSYQRPSWRRPLIALGVVIVIAGLIAVGAYVAYNAYGRYVNRLLTVPGCQAGTGVNAIGLDFGETADAATIAGVAARERLPREALTVAYATAWQESKLENPSYGDRDSVGIFQQRPSEGWGSRAQLEDPAYAARAFFGALVKIPGYAKLPVDVAAQDVQRSADGAAYEQYAQSGAALATDLTATPHAVTCWYDPASQAASEGVSAKLNLRGALSGFADAFGRPGADGAVTSVSVARAGGSAVISAARGDGWTAANWLVANASSYGITQVSYGGYQWTAGLNETSWQPDSVSAGTRIVAS
ncbi:MAG TPA: hypothetical protein VIL16_16670 [Trebonia sp.]